MINHASISFSAVQKCDNHIFICTTTYIAVCCWKLTEESVPGLSSSGSSADILQHPFWQECTQGRYLQSGKKRVTQNCVTMSWHSKMRYRDLLCLVVKLMQRDANCADYGLWAVRKKTCASLNYNFMVLIETLHNGTHEVLRYCIKRCTIIVAWHTPYRLVNLCRRPTCHCGQWSQSFDNRMVIALPRLDSVQKLLLFCHARWLDSNLKEKQIKKTIRDIGRRRKIFHSTHPTPRWDASPLKTLLSHHFSPNWGPNLSRVCNSKNDLLKELVNVAKMAGIPGGREAGILEERKKLTVPRFWPAWAFIAVLLIGSAIFGVLPKSLVLLTNQQKDIFKHKLSYRCHINYSKCPLNPSINL